MHLDGVWCFLWSSVVRTTCVHPLKHLVRYNTLTNEKLFHATLGSLFSRTNGQYFVETHACDIMDLHTANVISPDVWSTIIRNGAKIEMSVIVPQASSDRELVQCPCCHGPDFENKQRTGMLWCVPKHRLLSPRADEPGTVTVALRRSK